MYFECETEKNFIIMNIIKDLLGKYAHVYHADSTV